LLKEQSEMRTKAVSFIIARFEAVKDKDKGEIKVSCVVCVCV